MNFGIRRINGVRCSSTGQTLDVLVVRDRTTGEFVSISDGVRPDLDLSLQRVEDALRTLECLTENPDPLEKNQERWERFVGQAK